MNHTASAASPGEFATTRWTLVLRSRGGTPEAQAALGELCAAYWNPVFGFLRRTGLTEDAARDATQEFFARILARGGVGNPDPARGRFRSFLLGAVKHFLSDLRDRERAAKRGGGREHLPLAEESVGDRGEDGGTPRPASESAVGPPGDGVFDRDWAVTLVNRAVDRLAAEQAAVDRAVAFAALKPWLLGSVPGLSQGEVASALGWTENAVRVAVHRLRRRFRELVHAEIGQTVGSAEEVAEEVRYLLDVLAGVGGGRGAD